MGSLGFSVRVSTCISFLQMMLGCPRAVKCNIKICTESVTSRLGARKASWGEFFNVNRSPQEAYNLVLVSELEF